MPPIASWDPYSAGDISAQILRDFRPVRYSLILTSFSQAQGSDVVKVRGEGLVVREQGQLG